MTSVKGVPRGSVRTVPAVPGLGSRGGQVRAAGVVHAPP